MIDFNQKFNDSYQRVHRDAEGFYSAFYKILLPKSNEIKQLFDTVDMGHQRLILQSGLATLVAFSATKQATDYMFELAKIHSTEMKLTAAMYDIWMDALVETVRLRDPEFDNQIELGWRAILSPGIECMKHIDNQHEATGRP